MGSIKFGFMISEYHLDPLPEHFLQDLNRALSLISGHFDSAWIIDHLQFGNTPVLESFTTLAYLAALHPELKFGHSVICQSFRNPALLAKMGANLQFITGGRFLLGIGAGWHEEEYKAYGYPFPPARVRVDQLEETLIILRAMWSQPRTTFQGKYYQVAEAACEPRPDPIPPIMVGAFKPRMLALTARYADEWNVSSTGAVKYRRLAADFERACYQVQRDPATVRRSWGGGCSIARTQAEAEHFAVDLYGAQNPEEDCGFVGTPAQVIEQMRAFIDLGVSSFMLDCGGFPRLTTLELLLEEVLPALNS